MWAKSVPYLLELAAAGGLIFMFAFISWTKIALGAALTAAGAFFPHSTSDKASGSGVLKLAGVNVTLKGSLRVGVLLAGIILIVNEGIVAKVNSSTFSHAADTAAKQMKKLVQKSGTDTTVFEKMNNSQQVEELTELRNALKQMQTIKPDARLEATLASIEKLLQVSVLNAEMDGRVMELIRRSRAASAPSAP